MANIPLSLLKLLEKKTAPAGMNTAAKGPKLVGYEWASKEGERYSPKEEGLVPVMVSDWEKAEKSQISNRNIVHKDRVHGSGVK